MMFKSMLLCQIEGHFAWKVAFKDGSDLNRVRACFCDGVLGVVVPRIRLKEAGTRMDD